MTRLRQGSVLWKAPKTEMAGGLRGRGRGRGSSAGKWGQQKSGWMGFAKASIDMRMGTQNREEHRLLNSMLQASSLPIWPSSSTREKVANAGCLPAPSTPPLPSRISNQRMSFNAWDVDNSTASFDPSIRSGCRRAPHAGPARLLELGRAIEGKLLGTCLVNSYPCQAAWRLTGIHLQGQARLSSVHGVFTPFREAVF
jgi:hypothetical protein